MEKPQNAFDPVEHRAPEPLGRDRYPDATNAVRLADGRVAEITARVLSGARRLWRATRSRLRPVPPAADADAPPTQVPHRRPRVDRRV